MSALSRGSRNVFRNPLRTLSVVVILGISFGLVVVMLAARNAVDGRITEVKQSIGNTITISPAGARGFIGGGEPLTNAQVETVQVVAHVTRVDATIDAQLITDTDTTLKSAIEPGTLGGRGGRVFFNRTGSGGTTSVSGDSGPQGLPEDFKLPILAIGTNNASFAGGPIGSTITLFSGTMFDASSEAKEAVVGKTLADKNSLTPGTTFTAFKETITVTGIYDAGNEFANNSVIFPLRTLQTLSDQVDQVTTMIARVDSVDNLVTTTTTIKSKLGTAADVTSSEETVKEAVKPLENIKTIATTSLIGALIAAAVITLLTMVMIVRERRKEIAVLKALGASDATITTQFVTEAVILSLAGGIVGTVLGALLSNPILRALLASSQNPGPRTFGGPGGPGGLVGTFSVAVGGGVRAVQGAIRDLQAVVDWHLIMYALVAAVIAAILGSAFPAWLIGKVRPAEVLRTE